VTISARRDRLRQRLEAEGLDALLITRLVNVRYLSGFTGSNAALLIRVDDDTPVLATDGRYRTQAAQQAPDAEIVIERACGPHLARRAAEAGVGRLGFESHVVTVEGFDALMTAAGDTELVRAAGIVEQLREVKDSGEIALLRLACEAADAALTDLVQRGGLRPGRTEREVGRELESLMLDHGADGVSFETIVAAGANSAIPHHRPTDAVLAAGDFVKIDFGALVCGYHSDMTRTFVLAPAAQWQLDLYELVATAQRAGSEAVVAGAPLREIDAASRRVIAEAGYGDNFTHGLGHGVGLEIHEAPGINSSAAGTLLAGSAVTVEPGVYLPDRGGVRIEDTLVVCPEPEDRRYGTEAPEDRRHESGEPGNRRHQTSELLTQFPKELAILG